MQKKKPVAILIVVLLIVLVLAFFLLTSKKLNVLGKYCTVEFSGTNEKIDSKTVKCGNKIEEVGDPEREGFIFLGWYDGDEEFDFDEEVNEDMVLTAKWESEDDPNVVPVTGIYVESNSIKIKVKQSMVVVAKVKPDDATNTKLIWSSSDEKVVTVDKKGTIEGKSAGTAIITVKTEDGNFKEEIKVEVEKVATSVSLQNDEITLSVGQSKELKVFTKPEDLKVEKYSWSSSNESVAKVDQNGKITAIGVGQATITVKAEKEGLSASVIVNVVSPVTGISLNTNSLTLFKGDTANLVATVSPASASNKTVMWSSSDSFIASVDGNGKVTAKRAGQVEIMATTRDGGFKATATVVVKERENPIVIPTEIHFDKASYTLEYGESIKIKATIIPENVTDDTISWSSSNSGVVIVDAEGVVTTISPGTATITATTVSGGKKTSATIKVVSHVVDVNLDTHEMYLKPGETGILNAKVTPVIAENKKLNWVSSNTNIASVDQNGKVTAVAEGTAIITVRSVDSGITDSAEIVVSKEIVNVTSVSLNKSSLSLNAGASETLGATVYPLDATDKRVTWSSSNPSVATVDQNGKVTAKSAGDSVITVKTHDGSKTTSASVRVNSVYVEVSGVSLNKTSLTMNVGDNETLLATVMPSNATEKGVTWSSSNPSVVSVDQNGKLLALSVGESNIIVKTKSGGKETRARVVVIQKVTNLQISKRSLTLTTGNSDNLSVAITPDNATDKRVVWSSSNESVAKVDQNGKVTAMSSGTAVITVKTYDNTISDSISVVVNNAMVPVTGLSLDPTSISISVGGTKTITASISPSNATDKSISWRTSNSSIAEVSSTGVITGKGVGSTTVTACTADGNHCANVSVTVTKAVVKVVNITLDPTYFSVPVGGTEQVTATVLPSNADNKSITWSCNRTSIATVDQNGVVTGVSTGVATIYAASNDGSGVKKSATVNVVAAPVSVQSVSLDKTSFDLNINATMTLKATVSPSDATNKRVTWSSSNDSIATVSSSGVVTGKSVGTAIITVKTADGNKTATATVNVKSVSVTGVSLSKTSISLGVGGSETITATVSPSNATNKKVTWSSSNTSVATVSSSGVVTAKAIGTTTITATTEDGNKKATATVTVTTAQINVTSVSVSPSLVSINVNSSTLLTATVLPTNATNKKVTWSSNNTSVATVDKDTGRVTGISKGTAVITARTDNGGKTATATITVIQPVTGITVSPTRVSLSIGDTTTISASVKPDGASNTSVTWSSSNTGVATVSSSGVVTAKAAGTATITAKTADGGYTATTTVTVTSSTVRVTGVSLNKSSLNLNVGGYEQLIASVKPDGASNTSVTWSSSNASVATVSGGRVNAVGPGTARITVKTDDGGYTASANVTVTQLATGVTISPSTISLSSGGTTTLSAIISPANASNTTVAWSSNNTSVATVDSNGKVTAVATGTATITATTTNGIKGTAVVTVNTNVVNVTKVTLDKSSLNLNVGATGTLLATVLPSNATNKSVTWSSSKPAVATVDSSGKVTAVSPGTSRVTVTTVDGGWYAFADVTVVQPATGITTSPSSVNLNPGQNTTLSATVSPSNASNKTVTWSSSNNSIATVDQNGKVTAVAVGTATITASTHNGKTSTVTVRVSAAVINVTGVSLNKNSLNLNVGENDTLSARILPDNATNKSVVWTSSNSSVATVSNGKVTAVSAGTAIITVTTVDGAKTATATVTVIKPVTSIKLDKTSISLEVGKATTLSPTISPSDATNKKVTWSSSNPSIATVDQNGKVTAVSKGTATITAATHNNKTATATITVIDGNVSVSLNKSDIYLSVNQSEKLTATLSPSGASTTLTWTSSNTSVATVSNGTVLAKGTGSSTITVKTTSGSTATAVVHVPITFAGDGYTYNAKPSDDNKKIFKGEFKGVNSARVYQSWAYDDGYIYVSQRDAYITKIKASSIYSNGTFAQVTAPCISLTDAGHLSNIDIENGKDGKKYLWVSFGNKISRINITSLFTGSGSCKTVNLSDSVVQYYNYDGNVAVDDVNRKVAIRTGTRRDDKYYIYDMDKFIAQSKTQTIPHLHYIAFSNHDPGSSTITSDNLSGWQGFDIDNNYLYVYEGYDAAGVAKTATGDNFGAFVSVYSIEGKQMVYRSNIRYPSKALASPSLRYFEPEGIKAIDNKLYVGFSSKEPGNPKENIYELKTTSTTTKYTDNANNKIHFINVNHLDKTNNQVQAGDAILIQSVNSSGKVVYGLIDTGDSSNKSYLINYLKSLSITKLEWVLLTHLHADHYGGVSELVKQGYTINKFYIKDYSGYDNVDATTRSNNVHNIITKAGYSYTAIDSLPHTYADEVYLELGQFRFAIFNTSDIYTEIYNGVGLKKNGGSTDICAKLQAEKEKNGSGSYCSENTNSVALLATLGNRSIYLSGDIGNMPAELASECVTRCNKMDEDKRPAVCDKCSYSSGLAGYFGSRALARSQVIDIYKTSHHGRSSNNSATIISKLTRNGTTPFTYAVVTGGIYTANDNFKVATTKKTLRDTGKMNVNNFYTTYNNGNIVFTIYNNKAITVSTSS